MIDSVSISNIGDISTNAGLFFGSDINFDYDFNGAIQEVRVWNSVVSDQGIENYSCSLIDNSHPNYSDLIGYWRLEENSGIIATDYSNSQNHGAISGATWLSTDSTVVYDFSQTPRQMDVASTVFTHLCISENPDWELEGNSLIEENCPNVGVNTYVKQGKVLIYPNPTTNNINISCSVDVASVTIYDIAGRLVFSNINTKLIDVSGLKTGMYQLIIKTEQDVLRTNFVKN